MPSSIAALSGLPTGSIAALGPRTMRNSASAASLYWLRAHGLFIADRTSPSALRLAALPKAFHRRDRNTPAIARKRERSARDRWHKRKQFSEEQIISILKEAEAGAVVTYLCRSHGMSSAIYYAREAKFGALEVLDARQLRASKRTRA